MIKLLEHQQKWVNAVLESDATAIPLFGEAGTGKTYPMCYVATELTKRHGGHALLVVPTRLVWNWALEHKEMCPDVPDLQRIVINGTAAERAQQLQYLQTFANVTSMHIFIGYDALRIHQQEFQAMENITVLVLDEAHAIKNRETQRARACKSINAMYRFTLTGTPIANRPNDLWSILHFLDPGSEFTRTTRKDPTPGRHCPHTNSSTLRYYRRAGCYYCGSWDRSHDTCAHGANKPGQNYQVRYRRAGPAWGSYNSFIDRYCEMEWNGYGNKITGGKNMADLNRRLERFGMTRWLIDDVLNLKPLVFQHVRLEPTTPERNNYSRVQNGIITMLESEHSFGFFQQLNPLAILTYLRQCTVLTPTAFAALRGGLLDEILESQSRLQEGDRSSKEEWLVDHIQETNGAKYLVYCHWIGACDHLMATLEQAGIKAVGIYGNNNKRPEDAVRIMKQFAEDPELRVIVGNESMSEGLNFQAARYVVFFHLPWLPKDVIQFIGRARRYGQKRTVITYMLSHRNTIDDSMAAQCLRKQADSDAIFDPDFSGRAGLFNIETAQGLMDLVRGG